MEEKKNDEDYDRYVCAERPALNNQSSVEMANIEYFISLSL